MNDLTFQERLVVLAGIRISLQSYSAPLDIMSFCTLSHEVVAEVFGEDHFARELAGDEIVSDLLPELAESAKLLYPSTDTCTCDYWFPKYETEKRLNVVTLAIMLVKERGKL